MYHHEIADLFGRRPHPDLALQGEWIARATTKKGDSVLAACLELHLTIENRGKGSARFASVSLSPPTGLDPNILGGYRIHGSHLREIHSARKWWVRVAAGSDQIIYPDDEMDVGYVEFALARGRRSYQDITVGYSLVCDGTPARSGTFSIVGDEITSGAERIYQGQITQVNLHNS